MELALQFWREWLSELACSSTASSHPDLRVYLQYDCPREGEPMKTYELGFSAEMQYEHCTEGSSVWKTVLREESLARWAQRADRGYYPSRDELEEAGAWWDRASEKDLEATLMENDVLRPRWVISEDGEHPYGGRRLELELAAVKI